MTSTESFARHITKIVIAQIAKDSGFEGIHENALEALSDLLCKYIEDIAQSSHQYSELASRTQSNFNDVRATLKDIGISLDSLCLFARDVEEIPFPKAIPEFPLKRSKKESKKSTNDTDSSDNTSLPSHIPDFLPQFPSEHTYGQTPVRGTQTTDPRLIRKAKSKEKRQVETSLAKLNEKLGNKPVINYDTALRRTSSTANPYLAPVKSKENSELRGNHDHVPPTPIQKDSQFMTDLIKRKMYEPTVTDDMASSSAMDSDNKRVYSELEESERLKKRQRAEQLLAFQHDGDAANPAKEDTSKPVTNTSGHGPLVERL